MLQTQSTSWLNVRPIPSHLFFPPPRLVSLTFGLWALFFLFQRSGGLGSFDSTPHLLFPHPQLVHLVIITLRALR